MSYNFDNNLGVHLRQTAPAYQQTLDHVATFGVTPGKKNYLILTFHDVLAQLYQREMNKSSLARCRQLFYNISVDRANTMFRKAVELKPVYGIYKGNRVEVGWTCSKKKAQKWFSQNVNKMLAND